jgi:hypothetical protein
MAHRSMLLGARSSAQRIRYQIPRSRATTIVAVDSGPFITGPAY